MKPCIISCLNSVKRGIQLLVPHRRKVIDQQVPFRLNTYEKKDVKGVFQSPVLTDFFGAVSSSSSTADIFLRPQLHDEERYSFVGYGVLRTYGQCVEHYETGQE